MEMGTVKFFNNSKDKLFGFIKPDSGRQDVFFHFNNGTPGNTRMPQKGDRVAYDPERTFRGPKAAEWAFEGEEFIVPTPTWNKHVPPLNECLRGNLDRFGLEDIMVTGLIEVRNTYSNERTKVEIGPMHLSQLCGKVRSTTLNTRKSDEVELDIDVVRNGENIGRVDSDNCFHYTAAPDLRTAVGWAIATDLGHLKELHLVNLDGETKQIETVIREAPVDGDKETVRTFWLGPFKAQLEKTFKYQRTSRFGDSASSWLYLLWELGTKQVHGRYLSFGNVVLLG